jgi:hypothetical protein
VELFNWKGGALPNNYDLWLNQVCETENTTRRYLQDISQFEEWARTRHGLSVKDIPSLWREAKYSSKEAEKDRLCFMLQIGLCLRVWAEDGKDSLVVYMMTLNEAATAN